MDQYFMRRALRLAARGLGRTSPNPAVGAVVVSGGRVVGEGYHRQAGGPHAEVYALDAAGPHARGATLYVTLEPCAHHGRTPPCAAAAIKAGVTRVVAAMVDPNPLVAGKGFEQLRRAGVGVEVGLMEDEARSLNQGFIIRITTGRPLVIWKTAMTLDGKIATRSGDSRWVTGRPARALVHRLRSRVDAVAVGIGTALADDPLLTCRLPYGRHPLRVVVDSRLRLPHNAGILTTSPQAPLVVTTRKAASERIERLIALGAEVVACGDGPRVDLGEMLAYLGRRGINSLFLEGGATLAAAFLEEGLIDRIYAFIAPKLVGGEGAPSSLGGTGCQAMADAVELDFVALRRVGRDVLITASLTGKALANVREDSACLQG